MERDRMIELAKKFLAAWTAQDIEAVAGCYTDDVEYRDPNTRGSVAGGEALRRYLKKLFTGWTMTWALREMHQFDGKGGAAILWHATFKRPGSDVMVECDGMDLVEMEGDLIKRNEVYFDRAVLAPLM